MYFNMRTIVVAALSFWHYQVAADPTPGFDTFTQPLTPGASISAGSVYTIKWTPSAPAGKISLILLEGSSNITLQLGPTIGGKYKQKRLPYVDPISHVDRKKEIALLSSPTDSS